MEKPTFENDLHFDSLIENLGATESLYQYSDYLESMNKLWGLLGENPSPETLAEFENLRNEIIEGINAAAVIIGQLNKKKVELERTFDKVDHFVENINQSPTGGEKEV